MIDLGFNIAEDRDKIQVSINMSIETPSNKEVEISILTTKIIEALIQQASKKPQANTNSESTGS